MTKYGEYMCIVYMCGLSALRIVDRTVLKVAGIEYRRALEPLFLLVTISGCEDSGRTGCVDHVETRVKCAGQRDVIPRFPTWRPVGAGLVSVSHAEFVARSPPPDDNVAGVHRGVRAV